MSISHKSDVGRRLFIETGHSHTIIEGKFHYEFEDGGGARIVLEDVKEAKKKLQKMKSTLRSRKKGRKSGD